MATFSPFGLQYYSSLASPANSATAVMTFPWDPAWSGWKGDAASLVSTTNAPGSPVWGGKIIQTNMEGTGEVPGTQPTNPILGVINGFKYTTANTPIYGNFPNGSDNFLNTTELVDGSEVYVDVITDPNAVYIIQTNSLTGIKESTVGMYARFQALDLYQVTKYNPTLPGVLDFPIGSSLNKGGISKVYLDEASIGLPDSNDLPLTGSYQMQIIGIAPGSVWYNASNPDPNAPYNSVLVKLVNTINYKLA